MYFSLWTVKNEMVNILNYFLNLDFRNQFIGILSILDIVISQN